MNFALSTSELPADDGVWTLPQSTGVPIAAPPAGPAPASDPSGPPAELSPGVLEERALLGAPFIPEPEDPLRTQDAEADLPPVGPSLQVDPNDPHRFRPPDVDPFQADQAEAAGYAWKRSGILQAPAGGDSMRLVDGNIVPSTGRKPSPPIAATDRAGAFQELQDGDSQNQFGRWVDAVVENDVNPTYLPCTDGVRYPMCDDDFNSVAGIPAGAPAAEIDAARRAYMISLLPEAPQGLTRSTVRDSIKSEYDVLASTQDPERLDALYPGVPPAEAGHRELQRTILGNGVTDGLGSGDEGALGESWYRQNYAPDAVSQVPMPDAASGEDRRADLVVPVGPSMEPFAQPSQTIEVKSGAEGLSGRPANASGPATDEHLQLDDYAQAVGNNTIVDAGGKPAQVVEHKYVNLDPRGAYENADTMAEQVLAGTMDYQAFNPAGETQTWTEADTWKLNLIPAEGADPKAEQFPVRLDPEQQMMQRPAAEIAEEIRAFTQQPIPPTEVRPPGTS